MSASLSSIPRRRGVDEPKVGLLDRKVAGFHRAGSVGSAVAKVSPPAKTHLTLQSVKRGQLNDKWAIEGGAANGPYPELRERLAPFGHKNPFDSKKNPREYMAWYHKHHPGYFARKSKEWLDRKPKTDQLAIFAEKNRKHQFYITAFMKLRKRIRGIAHSRPTFTAEEIDAIKRYPRLTEMYRRVMSEYPS